MKKTFILMFSIILSLSFADQKDLPKPYNNAELIPENLHGWFINQKQLDELFSKYEISTVIELGSWLGLSTVYFAKKLPQKGKVYAVDHWKGSIEHYTEWKAECKNLLPKLYDQFLSNIIHEKQTHKVIPIKAKTYEASFELDVKADLIYVDAAHDEKNVYQDLYMYYPKLKKGGIMCGDDWSWGGVRHAVKRFAEINNLELVFSDNFWYFKPKL